MSNLYQSRPSLIEAIQWTGDNYNAVQEFGAPVELAWPVMRLEAGKDGAQGYVPVPLGHWIVRQPGDLTDHWPVGPQYFAAKYEPFWPSVY